MRDKFIAFNRISCDYYLGEMKKYAIRDLKDETKKMVTSFNQFSKVIENIHNKNKIEPLKFLYEEIRRIDKKDSAIFHLKYIGNGELLETFPKLIKPLKLPIIRKEKEIIFILKKNENEINIKLEFYLKNLHEISECLKKEIESYNNDLLEKLNKIGIKLYEKISLRGWWRIL